MFHKVGMVSKTQVLAVLQYEKTVWLQDVVPEDQVGYLRKLGQGVWRVCKDEVELFLAFPDVLEHVTFKRETFVCFHLIHDFPDECVVLRVFFYGNDPVTSS